MFPADFDPAARDIIDGLLKIDINERYGCGSSGAPNDIATLKLHPFFKSIDFQKLSLM